MRSQIKNIKPTVLLTLLILLLTNLTYSQTQTEYNTISQRIHNIYAKDPNVGQINYFISITNANGSFAGLNYAEDSAYSAHANQMYSLAQAYVYALENPTSNLNAAEVLNTYQNTLQYFLQQEDAHVFSQNTWQRDAGSPRLISYGYFLMHDYITSSLKTNVEIYLNNAFTNRTIRYGHAADVVQQIEYLFPFYILKQDAVKIQTLFSDLASQLTFAKPWENFYAATRNSGIETDFSFTAHNDYDGRQIYNGGYGEVFIENVSLLLNFSHQTSLQLLPESYTNFSDFLCNGYQWTFFNKISDNSVMGRNNRNPSKQPPLATKSFQPYLAINPPRSTELIAIMDRIENGISSANHLSGNKYYWRSDMMVHRRNNYYFSVKMTSDRTVAPETDNTTTNYYAGAGVTHLMKNGTEYTEDYYLDFNNRQFPGTTTEQDSNPLVIGLYNWGENGKNEENFAGGVTNGNIGTCSMIWQKRGVKAYKSWFMFQDEIVALGAGITNPSGSAAVKTTLNQSRKFNPVYYKTLQGNQQILSGNQTLTNSNKLEWFFHDGVGYFPIANNDSFEISESTNANVDLFSIAINHGANPANKTYAYTIKPDITLTEANNNQLNNITILKNATDIQAVYNETTDVFQAVFFNAGQIAIPQWDNAIIKVNEASILMIKREVNVLSDNYDDTYAIIISNPFGEDSTVQNKQVTFIKDNYPLALVGNIPDEVNVVSANENQSVLQFNAWNSRWAGSSSREKIFSPIQPTLSAASFENNATFSVYPNPTNKYLNFSSEYLNTSYQIISVTGSIIKKGINNTQSINVSTLQNGLYFIKFTDDASGMKRFTKFVKH